MAIPSDSVPFRGMRERIVSPNGGRPVVFFDSGVGGLPYCRAFRAIAPMESIVYVADRANFPYGPKDRGELTRLLIALVAVLIEKIDPKLIVIACNTASVSSLDSLRAAYPKIPFVGTVPAVKPAAFASRNRRIGVLATERTVRDPYATHLVERFAPDCELLGIAAPELVQFVEHRYATATREERLSVAESYVSRFRERGVDTVVLGCTHFLFLAEEFAAAGQPDISIFDSREGVARRASNLLREGGLASGPSSRNIAEGKFYVTGDASLDPPLEALGSMFGLEYRGSLDGEK